MSNTDNMIVIKGRKIDQEKLREFLKQIEFDNIDQFETEEGFWKSPITGELFRSKYQLWGQMGAYLRDVELKDPKEPTRAGYVRALRQGLEPTGAQKAAHRDYARNYRRARRARLLRERGIEVPESLLEAERNMEPEPEEDPVKLPQMSWE